MKIARNKTTVTLSVLILMLAMAISTVALPTVNAQTGATMETYCFVGATPNPVGVGQEVLIHLGITQPLGDATQSWANMTVTVTSPNGTTETLGPFKTDATGGIGTIYTPIVVGNYTLQAHFPQQAVGTAITGMFTGVIPKGTIMLASDSDKLTLVVQQQQLSYNPGVPLPTEYWTRPINQQFREWAGIAANWGTAGSGPLGAAGWIADYNDAPLTPHMLWTKPLTLGGLVGGPYAGENGPSVGVEAGDAYEGKWTGSAILNGYLYYQDAPGGLFGGTVPSPTMYHCINLRTGEEVWKKTFLDNRTISFAQDYYFASYNYQGTFAYLWVVVGNAWYAFDATTGDWRATIKNVPSGTMLTNPKDGSIYEYQVDLTRGWMALWNMSALVSMSASWGSAFMGKTFDAGASTATAKRAWAWNVTIPKGLQGSIQAVNLTQGKVVGSFVNTTDVIVWAFSVPTLSHSSAELAAATTATLLFNKDWKAPASWLAGNESLSWAATDLTSNVGVVWSKELRQHYGFDLTTGAYLWVTDPQQYLDIYLPGHNIYNGLLYSAGYAGIVYAYNLTTGKTAWTYAANDVYHEILWSNNWPENLYIASDGKLYFFHQEHSPNMPLPRNAPAFCLNATTGAVIWRVDGLFRTTAWGGTPIMGDSVIAMYNFYDQEVYAIGKGPSATTVQAPMTAITVGNTAMIEGTVTDVSPGTNEASLTLRFPNGVPAVSDDSQGDWMKYVYCQFPRPTNATGVEVTLDAIDPNNNFVHLGTVTSDTSGTFGYAWKTPNVAGKYTIFATFPGSSAYFASYAETYAVVSEAPASPTPTPGAPLPPDTTFTIIGTGIAIIIAVAIGTILLLRKRS
jgi:hypothetical protein